MLYATEKYDASYSKIKTHKIIIVQFFEGYLLQVQNYKYPAK